MLANLPFGRAVIMALWRAKIKPPVELVVGDLEALMVKLQGKKIYAV